MTEQKESLYTLCQEIIWISTDKANTYCMLQRGHKGEHSIARKEEENAPVSQDKSSGKI